MLSIEITRYTLLNDNQQLKILR